MKNSKEGEVYTGSLLQQKRYFAVGKYIAEEDTQMKLAKNGILKFYGQC